jgi:hypothetical protein
VAREKKPKAPKPPKSVEELVSHALKLAATNPKAKWTGASAAALFNEKEENYQAAIDSCLDPARPLLRQTKGGGALTSAGFEKAAGSLPPEEVVALAKAIAAGMVAAERVEFLQAAIGRTPDAAAELSPLLEEAVAAKKAELEAEIAAKAKRAAAAAANRAALERALELSKQDLENEVNAVLRHWETLGKKRGELPAHTPAPELELPENTGTKRATPALAPALKTAEETDFRRYECDRLAAAWRDAWDAKKAEGAECLVDAMWNVRGFRMIGEEGETVEFNGRHHESEQSLMSGAVRIVRPGWLLQKEDGEYVALKAAVVKA